jgi:prepilin-type processing-associated H-X9-DG protein
VALAELTSPAKTVLIAEVGGLGTSSTCLNKSPWCNANIASPTDTTSPAIMGGYCHSTPCSISGLNGPITPNGFSGGRMATGNMGGRGTDQTGATADVGRHLEGSNFLFGDGHVKWLRGEAVSTGRTPALENCNQDNSPAINGCASNSGTSGTSHILYAAGSNGLMAGAPVAATFSLK